MEFCNRQRLENHMERQVTCINKPHHSSSHEHITHIGNSAEQWRFTREEAIRRIDSAVDTFYTIDASTRKRAIVGVVRVAGHQPYLRTHADGKWADNLLALGECGSACKVVG
jgi:hypothetical protein